MNTMKEGTIPENAFIIGTQETASWQSKILEALIRCYKLASPILQGIGVWAERLSFEVLSVANWPVDTISVTNVDAGGVPGQWVEPLDVPAERVVMYLHGGGYYFGSQRTHRALAANIALACKARVLLVDYRLAPEHVFPAALDDACTAYRWLRAQLDPDERVFIAGDSAGGGLLLATLFRLRDSGEQLPTGAVCISPFTDLAITGETYQTNAKDDPWFTRAFLTRAARMYLDGADAKNPFASPLYGDFSGLPPLLIQAGTHEVLLADATRLATRAQEAGVVVLLEIWQGMSHVWHALNRFIPEANSALEHIAEFLQALDQQA